MVLHLLDSLAALALTRFWQGMDQNELLRGVLRWLIFLANFAGGLVVGAGVVRGLWRFLLELVRREGGETPKEAIRLSLGRSLSLALEFQLGADILGTALDPTLRDVATLAAIVVLRTVLNFFLSRELREAEKQSATAQAATGAGGMPQDRAARRMDA